MTKPAAAANGNGTPDLAALATSLKSKAEQRAAGGAFAEAALRVRFRVDIGLTIEGSSSECSLLAWRHYAPFGSKLPSASAS